MPRTVALRGYTKRLGPNQFVAVCVTLNLVTSGATAAEARARLDALETAYLKDAAERNEWDAFVPRRAPLSFYVEYWIARLRRAVHRMGGFTVFNEPKPTPGRSTVHA